MKFNLKTRPKEWISVLENGGYTKHHIKTEEWFEEFEKELHKELDICEIGLPYCEKCQKIKEILGE